MAVAAPRVVIETPDPVPNVEFILFYLRGVTRQTWFR